MESRVNIFFDILCLSYSFRAFQKFHGNVQRGMQAFRLFDIR